MPAVLAILHTLALLACIWPTVCERRLTLSAKVQVLQLLYEGPLDALWLFHCFFNTQSIASEKICGNKISGDKIHPCLVSVFTVKVQINQCSGWLHSCYLPRSCEWYLQSSRKFHSALRLPKSLFSPLCQNAIWSKQNWPTAETAILVTVQWWCRVPEPCLFLPQFFFILFFFITAQHTTLAVITILTISIYDWSVIYSFASFTSTGRYITNSQSSQMAW